MKRITRIVRLAAAVTAAAIASSPVLAVAAQVSVQGRYDGEYPHAGVPIILASMEIVMASFETPRSEINAVTNLTADSLVKVEVVDTRPLANAEAIAWAETENAAGIEKLRAAIEKNVPFRADLEGEGVLVPSIIAAGFGTNGILILYAIN